MNKRLAAHSTSARWKIGKLRDDLDGLYVRADPRSITDPEVASDLGRYLCVRVSGYLEQASGVILRDYCEKNSWGLVQSFAHSWLDKMPNLSADALIKFVKRFSSQHAGELEVFLSTEERGTTLNALVGIRNDVAHGKQQGISREQAWRYLEVVEQIVNWLLDQFDSMNNESSA
ncbi:HEPN domain-containing protein [Kutzneria sp. NPDC052558]|uniref:HEPN domain-containing protein n=1 Tax=Kutzneria sp. NPDC052558 TaxID=3364121 RepID=UPI0037CCAD42